MVTKPRQKCKNKIRKSFLKKKNKVVSLINCNNFQTLAFTRVDTKQKGKNSQFSEKLVQVSETLSWALGQEIPLVRDSLLIEEEACANNLQYKVAWHLRKVKTFYLLNVKTTKMASQDYF